MGIESDHRTLARVVAPGVAKRDGGPIEKVTGIQGHAESVDPPNNNGYERTLKWTKISQAVDALTPFADKAAAGKAGSLLDVAKACRVDPKQLLRFYELFAKTEKVVTAFTMGVNQSSSGADKVNAIINCHLVTGRIGRPGEIKGVAVFLAAAASSFITGQALPVDGGSTAW